MTLWKTHLSPQPTIDYRLWTYLLFTGRWPLVTGRCLC